MNLVNGEDDYTRELESDKKQALWRAELSDGKIIVQDDGRPGLEPASAWTRLKKYVKDNNLTIKRVWLQFRSNHAHPIFPAQPEGFYFSKSIMGFLDDSCVLNFYMIGSLQNGKIMVQKWSVPELIHIETVERELEKSEDFLIRNENEKSCSSS